MLTYSQASTAARHVNFDEVYARAFDDSRPGSGVKLWRSDSGSDKRGKRISGRTRRLPDVEGGDVSSRALEITPADVVSRRARAWDGIKVEIIQSATHDKVEFRFRNACHLLLVYEEGVRDEGESVVGDLLPSTLRTLRRKLTFVPAGHELSRVAAPARPQSRRLLLFRSRQDADPCRCEHGSAHAPLVLRKQRAMGDGGQAGHSHRGRLGTRQLLSSAWGRSRARAPAQPCPRSPPPAAGARQPCGVAAAPSQRFDRRARSEERRVGKECRTRRSGEE